MSDYAMWTSLMLCACAAGTPGKPRLVSREITAAAPAWHLAMPASADGARWLAPGRISRDGGRTWQPLAPRPDFDAGLPHGYRRETPLRVYDAQRQRVVGILNALDTRGLDPAIVEPPEALANYYLRYRVSADGGETWVCDEPLICDGGTRERPLEGVQIQRNSVFLGDNGCRPIVTAAGQILLPVQVTLLGADGQLGNPGGGWTYTDALVLLGTWQGDRLTWRASQRVQADPARSTRGMIEPTVAQFGDGRLLMVLRGSNGGTKDPDGRLPSHKWCSVSTDGGVHWTTPEPWRGDDGQAFASPSSMSMLHRHAGGRVFWAGNISSGHCTGNDPRHPFVLAEVDPVSLRLRRDTLLVLDDLRPEDAGRGRIDLSHCWMVDDPDTGQLIVTILRGVDSYRGSEWTTARVALTEGHG